LNNTGIIQRCPPKNIFIDNEEHYAKMFSTAMDAWRHAFTVLRRSGRSSAAVPWMARSCRCQGWQGATDSHGWLSVAVPRMARSDRQPWMR